MKGIWRLAIAIVVAAGLGGLAAAAAWTQPVPQGAAPQGAPSATSPHCKVSTDTFPPPTQPAGGVVVPVVAHYMLVVASRPDGPEPPERKVENDRVRDFAKRVERHFRPPTGDADRTKWNVNDIWLPRKIQFHLVRTETCKYLVSEVGSIPVPIPAPNDMALFRRLNETFNAPDFIGVDLYVWPSFTKDGGYGSPRVTPPGEPLAQVFGGVWIKAGTLESEKPYRHIPPITEALPFDSVLLIAHELGHFLDINHNCKREGSPGPPSTACKDPGANGELMSFWADGPALRNHEVDVAKETLRRMGIPVP